MNKLKKMFKKDSDESQPSSSTPSQSTPSQSTPSQSRAPQTSTSGAQSGGATANPKNAEGVILHTNIGDITIALFPETPKVRLALSHTALWSTLTETQTRENFATLAATGKYDNVIFHRIIPGFMIQGGDPTGTGRGGTSIYGGKFEDEFVSSLVHDKKGVLSMANSGPGTNGSQFFICLGPTPHLNGKHTVFGQVVQGMETVDKLGSVRTGAGDRPINEVRIERCDVF